MRLEGTHNLQDSKQVAAHTKAMCHHEHAVGQEGVLAKAAAHSAWLQCCYQIPHPAEGLSTATMLRNLVAS